MRQLLPSFAVLFTIATLAGCSKPAARQEIPTVVEPGGTPRQAPPKAGTRERLGLEMGREDDGLGGITFHVDVPEGWEKLPESEFRQVNLQMADNPQVECYFTLLPGGGGGLEANINRWRRQMGLESLSAAEISALPKKPIFGQPATFVDIEGTFSGMGDIPPQENYRMYGLILHHQDPQSGQSQAFFLKMTGPKDVLANQEANFDSIATSLHVVGPGDDHTHDDHDGHDHDDHAGHDHAEGEGHDDHAGHDHAEGEGHDHAEETSDAAMVNPHAGASAAASAPDAASGFAFALPEGWEELPPRMMRDIHVTVGGQPDVECYLTVLSGGGGGLEMNINRWRGQMGQPDLSSDEIAALPKQPFMGGDATFVSIDGTFGGMRGDVQQENFRMYGMVHIDGDTGYFLKMTGPQDVLAANEGKFLAFAASINQGAASAAPEMTATEPAEAPSNPHGTASGAPAASSDVLAWTAPEGWQDAGERMMREVTYEIGDVECYISVLPGNAGGVDANINRWIGQMGKPALDEAGLAALPRIELLGQQVPLVEVGGDFTDMQGEEKQGFKLLGTLADTGSQMVFVKMTGPGAGVDAQREKFIAFCKSIGLKGAQ